MYRSPLIHTNSVLTGGTDAVCAHHGIQGPRQDLIVHDMQSHEITSLSTHIILEN
jgi:hypothetical protein